MMTVFTLPLAALVLTMPLGPEPSPQSAPPDPKPAQAAAKPKEPPKSPAAQPTLDELLGLPTSPGDSPAPPSGSPDQHAAELDEALKGEKIAEAFAQATKLMGDVAKRLQGSGEAAKGDPGVDTQRLQEDIIKKLEQVLDGMQQQQQQSSSSKSKPKPGDQQQEPQNSPSRAQQQQQLQQQQQGENKGESMGPERQDGQLRPGLEGAKAAWGSLPERVRDMLLQGAGDRFSSKYQSLTEAYYRKLAEEKDKK